MKVVKSAAVLFVAMFVFVSLASAQQADRSATVAQVKGKVEVRGPSGQWKPAKVGTIMKQGDAIRTMAASFAVLNLDGDIQTATVELKEKAQLTLAELYKDSASNSQNTLLDLSLGEVLVKTKKLQTAKSRFEVKTPTSIVGVRGTVFSVAVEAVE